MYNVELRGNIPIFEYLYLCIKNDILSGKIKKNSRLPSKRSMARSCGISVVTVENAYSQLQAEGYIRSAEKRGYFVEDISVLPKAERNSFDGPRKTTSPALGEDPKSGNGLFPFSLWSKLMRGVIADYGDRLLMRMPPEGVTELRCEIANYLYRSTGLDVDPERIIIGAGTEYLCSLLVMLMGRTRIYGFEDPCYKKIPLLYSSNGASVRYIPLDGEGVVIDKLNSSGASVLHISPSNHFPSGTITTINRRHQLLDWLSENENRYIIEDDFDSELRLEGRQIPSLMSIDPTGRVVFMNTFTKTISPSFRVGYIILPDKLLSRLKESMSFYSCTVPAFEQYTLARFISGGGLERHINRMRAKNKNVKARLIKALSIYEGKGKYTVLPCKTGTNICILFECKKSRSQISDLLKEYGIDLKFISDYTVEGQNAAENSDKTAVCNFSGMDDQGILRLADALGKIVS